MFQTLALFFYFVRSRGRGRLGPFSLLDSVFGDLASLFPGP